MANIKFSKSIEYRSANFKTQLEETGLSEIVNLMELIDFPMECNAENPKIIEQIDNLRQCLRSEGLEKQYNKIKEELSKIEPSMEEKLIVLVQELIKRMDDSETKIAKFNDGNYRVYSQRTHYWKLIPENLINRFLCEVAEKAGIRRMDIMKEFNKRTIRLQFDEHISTSIPEKNMNSIIVNLKNGVFEISNDFIGLREHRASDYFTYILTFSFEPTATATKFLRFLNDVLPEKQAQMALAEVFAYPLCPQLNLEILAVMQGPGGTGKSTLMKILEQMYGPENVCSYDFSTLCSKTNQSSYYRAELGNYLVNYSSEMGGEGCDYNLVKKMISREPVEARNPYGKPFTLKNYCPMIFNVNDFPIMENTSALWRRIKPFGFHNIIPAEKIEIDFVDEIIKNEMPGVFNWVLEGLKRLIDNKKLTYSPKCDELKNKLRQENNPVETFMCENGYQPNDKDFVYSTILFKEFQEFCIISGFKAGKMSRTKFLRRLEEIGYRVDRNCTNHQYRIYCKTTEKSNMQSKDDEISKMFGISKCNV